MSNRTFDAGDPASLNTEKQSRRRSLNKTIEVSPERGLLSEQPASPTNRRRSSPNKSGRNRSPGSPAKRAAAKKLLNKTLQHQSAPDSLGPSAHSGSVSEKPSVLRRDIKNLSLADCKQLAHLEGSESHKDMEHTYLRSRSVRKVDPFEVNEPKPDVTMQRVQSFFTFVAGCICLVICWAFVQDFMNLTEPKPPVSSNPYVAQILPMFQGEIDFREYGSAVQDQITAQEIMTHLGHGDFSDDSARTDIGLAFLEMFEQTMGVNYGVQQAVSAQNLQTFGNWNEVVFKVKETERGQGDSISAADNNNEEGEGQKKNPTQEDM